ncbi:unnamed protein product [Caenorhabditis auriculariae]|uniref:XPA C-terminal domain-containing protein n=1 Tax=Caenorhabditis auriculariae TaxID=2777116 RepID=A0A8S1GRS6_9PELO|nr:unnamed protein product [Caenorhabditis auriculariae]
MNYAQKNEEKGPISSFMAKRRFNPTGNEDRIPTVEKNFTKRVNLRLFWKWRDTHSNEPAPENCTKCDGLLMDSWLWERFSHPVCETCRDEKNEHKLLARTDVKNLYLLKDADLDLRKPPLRYWAKKNPHNPRYGDMKLYLKCQVEKRMIEVHGSWEELEMKKETREQLKDVRSEKRFEKKLKDLRQQIRGSSNKKVETMKAHDHVFGAEKELSNGDWEHSCQECGFKETFEKL